MLFIALPGERHHSHPSNLNLNVNNGQRSANIIQVLLVLSAESLREASSGQLHFLRILSYSRFSMLHTTVYVGAIIAIVVLCTLGAILRVLAIRRSSYIFSWFLLH